MPKETKIFQSARYCKETGLYRLMNCENCAPLKHVIFVKEGEPFPLCYSCFTGSACWKFEKKIDHDIRNYKSHARHDLTNDKK